jgi:glucose-1-phosphate thymidylyltransferase
MKALVLCAGRGTRLRPLTYTRAKAALPVAGQPVLTHILAYLSRFGFTDVGIVISPDQAELRELSAALPGQQVTFVEQETPLGIAHAVSCARDYLEGEPFLLYLGDNLTNEDLSPALQRFRTDSPDALIAVRTVPNPQAFGVAELSGERVARVAEKPKEPQSNLAIAGIYLFRPSIHQTITGLTPSARGEYEITDAIAGQLARGSTVLAHTMSGWWQDMGTPAGMLAANALLLRNLPTLVAPDIDLTTTTATGAMVIGAGATLQNVQLEGPVFIGAGSRLENACIGPFASVGEGALIRGATIANSILLPGCSLEGPSLHLEESVLGVGATVQVKAGGSMTLLVGDDGHLQIPPGGVV